MHERNKWAFWFFVIFSLAIVCAPSTLLLSTFQDYLSFLEGFQPGTLSPGKVRFIPHREREAERPSQLVRFIPFRLKAPGAKKVFLIGDFEAWRPEAVPLRRRDRRTWEVILPLPPGDYHYLFTVDGAATLDPKNKDSEEVQGRLESVKTVR